MSATILVVDDEPSVLELVTAYLERDGHRVRTATDGRQALDLARREHFDLIILDIMLPELDGIDVLTRLRRESNVYVILLTARAEETDKIVGLSLGADDYVTKPFSPRELSARVKAALRRLQPSVASETVSQGPLRIDLAAHRVWLRDQEVDLTPTEFDLLSVLAQNAGRALSRTQLLQQVWGYDFYGEERVVDVHVGHLRQKLEPHNPIETVRGIGYRFEPTS